MTYNIAICDDNPVDLKAESELIKQCFNAKKLSYNINLFNNSKDLESSYGISDIFISIFL